MTDDNKTLVVVVATFGNEYEATESLNQLKNMDKGGSIKLVDAAVVVHDTEGKVTFKETSDPNGKQWAKRGVVAGGLVGLIFPPSIIAGAVIGGAGGGVWGKIRDKGLRTKSSRRSARTCRLAPRQSSRSLRTGSSSSSSTASRATRRSASTS